MCVKMDKQRREDSQYPQLRVRGASANNLNSASSHLQKVQPPLHHLLLLRLPSYQPRPPSEHPSRVCVAGLFEERRSVGGSSSSYPPSTFSYGFRAPVPLGGVSTQRPDHRTARGLHVTDTHVHTFFFSLLVFSPHSSYQSRTCSPPARSLGGGQRCRKVDRCSAGHRRLQLLRFSRAPSRV